ncbi:ComEC/Rec2 family competence protein [Candidatus Odyssella thessalonicensis]|uniref:ComEC/Rec2 family competence protein n=1 Tax=Candidatus Odyssella thessalonicensis TaxID=84647 RepID=UPI000225B4B7|nr:ComEC/Rec2 family competence protein [Candidatus Odyssella thessalonicensis]
MASSIKDLVLQETSRLFLWFPAGMGLGIMVYLSLATEPPLWVTLFILLLSGLAWNWSRHFNVARLPAGIALSISLGAAAIHSKTWYLTHITGVQPLSGKIKGEFSGIITNVEYRKDRQRWWVALQDGRLVRLSDNGKVPLAVGYKIRFRSTLLPFSPPVLEDGYDFGRAAFFKGLSATGRMNEVVILDSTSSASDFIHAARSQITQALFKALPGEAGAIAAALVTGERGQIPERVRQAYADAGIAHVLAISGLHLSMIAGLIFMIFRRGLSLSMRLAEHYNLKKIASIITFPFLIGYLFLSGLGVPAMRAFVMVAIVLLGILVDRKAISMRTLALAAIVILLIQPENLLSASFALSFAAVMALIAAYESGWAPLKEWAYQGRGWRHIVVYLSGIVASTVIATLATLPITLYIFNRISLQAILGNLCAIPLMGFVIMPLLLLGVISLIFGQASILFSILGQAIKLMTKVATWTATLPGAAIQLAKPPEAFIWLIAFGGLWLCLWRTKIRFLGILPCVVAVAFLWVKPSSFIWVSSEALIYWYDGKTLSTFANVRHNSFAEEILLRQLGLKQLEMVPGETTQLQIANKTIVLLNERFSFAKHAQLCQQAQIIVSSRYVPISYEDRVDIILDRSYLARGQGALLRLSETAAPELYSPPQRPWHPAPG